MRGAVLAVIMTVAGLVALLSFKTHSNNPERTGEFPPQAVPLLASGERGITGNTITTIYGPVKVQAVLPTSKIVGVNICGARPKPAWTCRLASTPFLS